jgi:hypothetical protein
VSVQIGPPILWANGLACLARAVYLALDPLWLTHRLSPLGSWLLLAVPTVLGYWAQLLHLAYYYEITSHFGLETLVVADRHLQGLVLAAVALECGALIAFALRLTVLSSQQGGALLMGACASCPSVGVLLLGALHPVVLFLCAFALAWRANRTRDELSRPLLLYLMHKVRRISLLCVGVIGSAVAQFWLLHDPVLQLPTFAIFFGCLNWMAYSQAEQFSAIGERPPRGPLRIAFERVRAKLLNARESGSAKFSARAATVAPEPLSPGQPITLARLVRGITWERSTGGSSGVFSSSCGGLRRSRGVSNMSSGAPAADTVTELRSAPMSEDAAQSQSQQPQRRAEPSSTAVVAYAGGAAGDAAAPPRAPQCQQPHGRPSISASALFGLSSSARLAHTSDSLRSEGSRRGHKHASRTSSSAAPALAVVSNRPPRLISTAADGTEVAEHLLLGVSLTALLDFARAMHVEEGCPTMDVVARVRAITSKGGYAFAEMLQQSGKPASDGFPAVDKATVFVSHAQSCSFQKLLDALDSYMRTYNVPAKECYFWCVRATAAAHALRVVSVVAVRRCMRACARSASRRSPPCRPPLVFPFLPSSPALGPRPLAPTATRPQARHDLHPAARRGAGHSTHRRSHPLDRAHCDGARPLEQPRVSRARLVSV